MRIWGVMGEGSGARNKVRGVGCEGMGAVNGTGISFLEPYA